MFVTTPLPIETDILETNILSVDLESWHQLIYRNLTGRLIAPHPSCVEATRVMLSLFKEKRVTATFFVLGYVAEAFPDLVWQIHDEGHEVASHGYTHTPVWKLSRDEFRKEVGKSLDLLEGIIGKPVVGFRAPEFSIVRDTIWGLEVLRDLGLKYDSSIFPFPGRRYGVDPFPAGLVSVDSGGGSIIEVPPSTITLAGRRLPVAGGGYFRLLPFSLIKRAVNLVNEDARPFVFYVHPWEFAEDRLTCSEFPTQPGRSQALTLELRWNLFRRSVPGKMARMLDRFRFSSIKEALGHAINK